MPENIPENLEQAVKEEIAKATNRNIEELNSDTNFFNDLGVDSIKAIEITVAIERRFKVRVRDEQIPQITTVSQAIEVVKQALKKKENEGK